MNKIKIAGRHLWSVQIEGELITNPQFNLWITTSHDNSEDAARAARKFLRQNKKTYGKARIVQIKNEGTLDA